MSVVQKEPPPAAASHPEEIKSTFELHIGDQVSVQASARITPAGVICAGLAAAAILLSVGYLASSRRRGWR